MTNSPVVVEDDNVESGIHPGSVGYVEPPSETKEGRRRMVIEKLGSWWKTIWPPSETKEGKRRIVIEKLGSWWKTIWPRQSLWNKVSVVSCVIAVAMDPLFFYIPYIDDDKKCLGTDKNLRTAALVSRSLTDISFIVHIMYQIREAVKAVASDPMVERGEDDIELHIWKLVKKLSHGSFVTNILAVVPIPQVLIAAVYFKMEGPSYLGDIKIVNVLLLAQYLPRMYRVYLSTKRVRYTSTKILLKGAFNFFMYIVASHVLGAFWYFFSIQREMACWHHACKSTPGCTSTYYCDDATSINTTLFTTSCPINPPNAAIFDFGIFADGLESGNTGPIRFSTKLFNSLWWGLRNISNFGTNLETSTYDWENCFAILISLVGLLLFCYLIGNVQECMKSWENEKKLLLEKIRIIQLDMGVWMAKMELPQDLRAEINNDIRDKLEKDKDANMETLYSVLSWRTKESLKRYMCMRTLSRRLRHMDPVVLLESFCDYLKPVIYPENRYFVRMGKPIDRMMLITRGTLRIYSTSHQAAESLEEIDMDMNCLVDGGVYGADELLSWASTDTPVLPIAKEDVKCHTKVEGFVLMASDLEEIYFLLWGSGKQV